MKLHVLVGGVQIPAPIRVRLTWRPGVELADADKRRVKDELQGLAWELSQAEALLHDAIRVAGGERAYLMPRIELRLPLYEAKRRLRIVFLSVDEPSIHVVDEAGKRLADVRLG